MRSPAEAIPNTSTKRRLLSVLGGEALSPPPVWLMRQAGRYLPEYRQVRASVGGFLDLCYTPALAAEVTLQPIRRYGFDAAILFSDILVVPDALGQRVRFVEGEGPRLDPITTAADLKPLDLTAVAPKFSRVSETVQRLRQDLPRGALRRALPHDDTEAYLTWTNEALGHPTKRQAALFPLSSGIISIIPASLIL